MKAPGRAGQPELKHTPAEIRRVPVLWHGTILAQRPVMLPEVSYWARIRGAGHHAYGSCRPEVRALLRAARPKRAA